MFPVAETVKIMLTRNFIITNKRKTTCIVYAKI